MHSLTFWLLAGPAFLLFSLAIGCLLGRLLSGGSLTVEAAGDESLSEAEIRELLGPPVKLHPCEICGTPTPVLKSKPRRESRQYAQLCDECYHDDLGFDLLEHAARRRAKH